MTEPEVPVSSNRIPLNVVLFCLRIGLREHFASINFAVAFKSMKIAKKTQQLAPQQFGTFINSDIDLGCQIYCLCITRFSTGCVLPSMTSHILQDDGIRVDSHVILCLVIHMLCACNNDDMNTIIVAVHFNPQTVYIVLIEAHYWICRLAVYTLTMHFEVQCTTIRFDSSPVCSVI